MNVFHTISTVGRGSFGLGPVALNLVKEQRALGADSRIWCLDREDERQWAADSGGLSISAIRGFPRTWPEMSGLSLEMERSAGREIHAGSLIHQHGIWTGLSRIPIHLKTQHQIPYVITPHGSLEKWALNKSSWKKRLALFAYENNNLHNAPCLHAVGENEVGDIRDFGLCNPVAVIQNGIPVDWIDSQGDGSAFRQQFGIQTGKRIALFLSRITPKKGLPMLLHTLCGIPEELKDWQLIIAGADEFGHRA